MNPLSKSQDALGDRHDPTLGPQPILAWASRFGEDPLPLRRSQLPRATQLPRPFLLASIVALLFSLPTLAFAQTTIDPVENLPSERPEAWAMRYFAAALRGHGFGSAPARTPARTPGDFEVGFEVGWLPSLDAEQETVGFGGTKREDLDRSSWTGRLRGEVVLPAGLVLDAGWIPPVEISGLEPNVITLGLSRSVYATPRWSLGLRLSADHGRVQGDITCDAKTVAAGEDPILNPFQCLEPSQDVTSWHSGTLEATLSRLPLSLLGNGRVPITPYLTVAASYLDAEFQVDARYGVIIDKSTLRTHALEPTFRLGIRGSRSRSSVSVELAFAPLEVERTAGKRTEDGLLNLRALWSLRF
jgi:hypothetical protein